MSTDKKSFSWFFSFIRRNLAAGLVAIFPIVITFWVVYVLWAAIDTPLRAVFRPPAQGDKGLVAAVARFLENTFGDLTFMAQPGVGLILLFLLLLIIGILARTLIGRFFVGIGDRVLGMIPFVKTLYLSTKQLLSALLGGGTSAFREVVLVEYPKKNCYVVGFLASRGRGELATINMEPVLNVFVPTTPNPTSGFLLLIPESRVKRLHMSIEDAVKFIISSGIVADPNHVKPTIFETPTTKFSNESPPEGVHPAIHELTQAIETDIDRVESKSHEKQPPSTPAADETDAFPASPDEDDE